MRVRARITSSAHALSPTPLVTDDLLAISVPWVVAGPTSLALHAPHVTRRGTRSRDRSRAARADRLSGCPAALCRLRLRSRGRGDPLRALRRGARDSAHGDRRRSRLRGPGGLCCAVRRRRTACGPRAQVRTQTVSGRCRSEGHARRPPAGGVPRGRRTGAGRAVAMALARLRPGRGDRDLALRADRFSASRLPASQPRPAPGGAQALAAARRPAPRLGNRGLSSCRPPGRRRLDHRRDALSLRAGPA